MVECILSLNAWGTKQRWDTIAFFDTTGVEKSKYISSNAKELKLQDTRIWTFLTYFPYKLVNKAPLKKLSFSSQNIFIRNYLGTTEVIATILTSAIEMVHATTAFTYRISMNSSLYQAVQCPPGYVNAWLILGLL